MLREQIRNVSAVPIATVDVPGAKGPHLGRCLTLRVSERAGTEHAGARLPVEPEKRAGEATARQKRKGAKAHDDGARNTGKR